MKQLTLRKISEDVERELRAAAEQEGSSLNRAAIAALQRGLGLAPPSRKRRDLSALSGRWTAAEAAAFKGHVAIFETIDEEVWQ